VIVILKPARVVPDNTAAIRAYVGFMMRFIARGLCAASAVDPVAREELAEFPAGFTFEMSVLPDGPSLRVRKREDGVLETIDPDESRPNLAIRFKHLRHALVTFTFRESTAREFADDRMVVDGDIAAAMRMQRVLDRLLVLTLPRSVAGKALKRVPSIPRREKIAAVARLYAQMAKPR
jgi:hypothetical protein